MSARARIAVLVGIAACFAGAAVMLALARGGPARRAPTLVGPRMPANLRAADFRLRDQHGRPVRLASLRGRVVVLTFLHSLCHSTCPVTVQTIRGALDDIGPARRRVDVLAISVAPREDTPRHVARFVALQHAGGFLRYLTGSPAALRRVWRTYGIHPLTQGEDHTAFVLLVDPRGILRVGYPSHQVTPEDLGHDLRVLTAEAA